MKKNNKMTYQSVVTGVFGIVLILTAFVLLVMYITEIIKLLV